MRCVKGRRGELPDCDALISMAARAVIFGCTGTRLTPEELAFFRDADPWGFILFARNINTPLQVSSLTRQLRSAVGRADAPVLIDQEGGRVARLNPPRWRVAPPAAVFGRLYADNPEAAREACYLNARLLADELMALGVTVDCAPVLDAPVPGAHQIIGDRALATDPGVIATLGRAMCEGFLAGGVLPVIKHIPGHGRAGADSHHDLPAVATPRLELSRTDFAPFKALSDMPLAMTAHVAFTAIDGQTPASLSKRLVNDIIRGEIGFDGALMCDDLGMAALEGDFPNRASRALAAGCDLVLHCSGSIAEMRAVMPEVVRLTGTALARCDAALARRQQPESFDVRRGLARLVQLLADLV